MNETGNSPGSGLLPEQKLKLLVVWIIFEIGTGLYTWITCSELLTPQAETLAYNQEAKPSWLDPFGGFLLFVVGIYLFFRIRKSI